MAEMPSYPCQNPTCANCGKPHPHCHCGPMMAQGGVVPGTPSAPLSDPSAIIGDAAVEHGLLGILKNVGKPNMMDPEKHSKVLHEARNQHAWRQAPREMTLPRTHGTRLGDHLADGNHDKAAEHMHGHPLVGGATKSHLKEMMSQLSGPLLAQAPHPEGFRGAADYLSNAKRGQDKLSHYIKGLFGSGKSEKLAHPDVSALKEYLQKLDENPQSLLDVGGSLGHYLPDHSVQVSATAASAVNYLKSIRPAQNQGAALDKVMPPSKAEEEKYDRQVAIAQNPLLALQHLKGGTLQPLDLNTVQTIYPGLYKSIVSKATEQLIDSMARGKSIPYHERRGLGLLIGQPLDSTMTPASMQAIMSSAAPQQAQQQKGPGPKKASGVELKEVDKVTDLYKTSAQARQTEKRS